MFVLLLLSHSLLAQYTNPPAGHVFDDSTLPRIEVTLDQTLFDEMFISGNEQSDVEHPANVSFIRGVETDVLNTVGFRLRGNTSRYSAKKSFKVSINSFEKGRDYKGLEKFNLNGEHNDPSIIRSKLGWDLMRDIGAIASRANHVELYVNGEYRGLYIHVEHIDEEFIEERFGNKTGNLYKCLWPADLNYLGPDPEAYKFEHNGRQAYELKINEEINDYSGLARFIEVVNTTPDDEFVEEIQKVFDVSSFLKALAVEALLGHWDNYSINKNNYYLYDNPADGKFYYIPYDLDNTMGIDWFQVDWSEVDIYRWYNEEEDRPLARRILEQSAFRLEYTLIVNELLESHFSPEVLNAKIDAIKSKIQDAAERDTYRTLDYGFTVDDFNNSFSQPLGYFHTRWGLKDWTEDRYESAVAQLDVISGIEDEKIGYSIYPNPSSGYFTLEVPSITPRAVQVIDLQGRIIISDTMTQSFTPSNTLNAGMYLVRVNEGSGWRNVGRLTVIGN